MSKQLTVQELIDRLSRIEDKSLPVELTTGHEDIGRFYGRLYRVSTVDDCYGARVRLTGDLMEGVGDE
ncbi:hypothetical protein [Paenibacillus apiarius]|uniref:hypothetical protein n=1 Tax=Paenibacillus apiarius TaxID=46240 RepID=UPI003B3B85AD